MYTGLAPAHLMLYISLVCFRNHREFHQDLVIFGVVCFQGYVWGSEPTARLYPRLAYHIRYMMATTAVIRPLSKDVSRVVRPTYSPVHALTALY